MPRDEPRAEFSFFFFAPKTAIFRELLAMNYAISGYQFCGTATFPKAE
jgi:hypothetical protein